MASNSVKFNIEIGGTAYAGVAQLSKAMDDLNVKVNKTQGFMDMLGEKALGLNAITDLVGKVSSVFSGIAKAGMDNEMMLMNMRTLYQGNAETARDMYDRIAEYGKVTVYDKAGLVEAQKTMMSFGIEGEKAFSTLKQIGDIAMGDSQKMQSLSLAFACVDARYAVACDVQETTHFSYLGSFVLKEKLLKTSKKGGRQTASGKRLSLQKKRKHGKRQ